MQPPYIPPKDADFSNWLLNLATLIAGDPTDYGLVAGDATIITASNASFQSAYTLATNPATRTSPNIAAKDAARASAEATVRPYCVQVSLNMGVSDALKLGIGVNLPNPGRTPVPPPSTAPTLALVSATPGAALIGYADSTTPGSKKKPAGAIAMQVYTQEGVSAGVDPDAAAYRLNATKSPFTIAYGSGDRGKLSTIWGRWVTRSGPAGVAQVGPWSAALVITVQ